MPPQDANPTPSFGGFGLRDLDLANEMFRKGMDNPTMVMHMLRPMVLAGLAHVALARGEVEEAARSAAEARGLAEAAGMKQYYPTMAMTDAMVSAARGDMNGALTEYLRAEDLALQMGMRPLVWQSRGGAASALDALGRTEDATDKKQETQAMIDETAGLFTDEQMRALFVDGAANKLTTMLNLEDVVALPRR